MCLRDYLDRLAASEKLPHALLFAGSEESDKKQEASRFASVFLKSAKRPHPDLHELFPEGKSGVHPICAIRKLSEEAALLPYEAPVKVFIIHEAEHMLLSSSNALLKTLEEPPARTAILLLASHPDRLLPTILSRCLKIEFPSRGKNIDSAVLAFLVEGAPFDKIQKLECDNHDRLFETLLFWFRDRALLELGIEEYLHFPEHIDALKKMAPIDLEEVEQKIIQMRLALERSTKLATCLEIFFLNLSFIRS